MSREVIERVGAGSESGDDAKTSQVGSSGHTERAFREQIDDIVALFLGAFIVLGINKMWSTIK